MNTGFKALVYPHYQGINKAFCVPISGTWWHICPTSLPHAHHRNLKANQPAARDNYVSIRHVELVFHVASRRRRICASRLCRPCQQPHPQRPSGFVTLARGAAKIRHRVALSVPSRNQTAKLCYCYLKVRLPVQRPNRGNPSNWHANGRAETSGPCYEGLRPQAYEEVFVSSCLPGASFSNPFSGCKGCTRPRHSANWSRHPPHAAQHDQTSDRPLIRNTGSEIHPSETD